MRQIVSGMVMLGLLSGTAMAQDAAPKKVTVTIGADVPLLAGYFFRGIQQEVNPKLTVQPFLDIAVAASDKVSVNFGSWNSLHSGSNLDFAQRAPHAWYESDIYAQVTFVAGKIKPAVLWTSYTSPADTYQTVNEIAGILMFDDSANAVPMSPKVIVAMEVAGKGQADSGQFFDGHKGLYIEAGIKPTVKASPDSGVTIGFPVKIGLSGKDYYETLDQDLELKDNKFGYFDVGAAVSVPLSMMKKGAWEFHAGIDLLFFGENRKAFQEGDDEAKSMKPVLNFGFSAIF